MNPALLSLLVLVACAPLAHRLDAPDSARAPTTPPAARPGVALVLYAEEPLTAPPADPHAGHHHAAPSATVKDPVCGMTLDPTKAKGGSVTVDGKTFHFCSSSCRREFEAPDGGLR